jgi:hypothetical protein
MSNRRLGILIAIACVLAAYFLWSDGRVWLDQLSLRNDIVAEPGVPPVQPLEPAKSAGKGTLNPLGAIKIQMLSEMVDRPLFNPSRASAPKEPPPVAVIEAQPETEPVGSDLADFTLLAVASSDAGKTAVVRRNSTNEVFHVSEGQSLSDWKIIAVSEREITVGRNEKTFQLKLFQNPAAQPLVQ